MAFDTGCQRPCGPDSRCNVVYDRDRITEDNIRGAPDLIVEVVSPATELKDRREKKCFMNNPE